MLGSEVPPAGELSLELRFLRVAKQHYSSRGTSGLLGSLFEGVLAHSRK